MPRLPLLVAVLCVGSVAAMGCEGGLREAASGAADAVTDAFGSADDSLLVYEVQPGEDDYRVELTGLVPDTLAGRARFGRVVDGPTGQLLSVVRLNTGLDFGGGLFVLVPGDRFPAAGTVVTLAPVPDSLRDTPRAAPWVAYRRGLLIDLVSTGGTIRFDTVTDTLVAGTLDVTLAGRVALPGGSPTEGELRARGVFRAHDDGAGFILGL